MCRVLDSNELRFSFSSIKYATKLSSLDLSDTGLFKLDGIQNAPALLSLDISRNDFKGDIPLEVFQISTLQQLFMGSNSFESSIPSNIGDLKQLKLLSCSSSNLQGSIPKSIGELTNLVHLNLEDNALTGTLPSEIGTLESLTFLDLSGQSLRGQLLSFEALRDLRRLDLSRNSFSGIVPSEFLSGVNPLFFDYLDLSQNFLTGEVPSILSHFDTIYLQENQFSAIDSELCDKSRGGVFKQFGCDAILCPSGTYNAIGRQDSEVNVCEKCPGSPYFGATSCNSTESQIPVEALELLPSDIVQESTALSKFYHQCGG
jgi:Leucine-rich repeat (LRR) protein